jgi:hypothetical protein
LQNQKSSDTWVASASLLLIPPFRVRVFSTNHYAE